MSAELAIAYALLLYFYILLLIQTVNDQRVAQSVIHAH